jgi:2-phospho-L-lactate guanylyltransferase
MPMSDTSPARGASASPGTPGAGGAGLGSFGVVVPVKRSSVAKSRLAPLGDDVRRRLVVAFAVDTVTAVLECNLVAAVLVVTDDVQLAQTLHTYGVPAIPDAEAGALNSNLRQGAAELIRRHPGLRPVALCADLPALRPDELRTALAGTGTPEPAFVTDADGAGTTLYASADLESFRPRFGPGSRLAHLDGGATELQVDGIESLRRDVDTPADLAAALSLGVGQRTSWVVTTSRLG